MTTRTKITGAVLGAAVAGALALVPLTDDGSGGEADSSNVILGTAEKEAVPSFTATDWVSYGDQVAVVRVTAEHERRDTDTDTDEGAGTEEDYLSRTVDLQVEELVWARSDAPALPPTVSVTADGWQLKDGTKKELGSPDSSRLEVGHDYVITFARFSDGTWSPLGSGGVLPYDHGRIGEGEFQGETGTADAYRSTWEERLIPGDEQPMAFRTAGKLTTGVQGILRSTTPDATAARYFGLDPAARYQKVAGASSRPTPSAPSPRRSRCPRTAVTHRTSSPPSSPTSPTSPDRPGRTPRRCAGTRGRWKPVPVPPRRSTTPPARPRSPGSSRSAGPRWESSSRRTPRRIRGRAEREASPGRCDARHIKIL